MVQYIFATCVAYRTWKANCDKDFILFCYFYVLGRSRFFFHIIVCEDVIVADEGLQKLGLWSALI